MDDRASRVAEFVRGLFPGPADIPDLQAEKQKYLESSGASEELVSVAVDGLQKAREGKTPSFAETRGLEAIILKDQCPTVEISGDDFEPPKGRWARLAKDRAGLKDLIRAAGRVDCASISAPYAGSGLLVAADLVMTNRHVALLFARGLGRRGSVTRGSPAEFDYKRERAAPLTREPVQVEDVLLIHPFWDVAVLKVKRTDGRKPVTLASQPPARLADREIAVVGYPFFQLASSDYEMRVLLDNFGDKPGFKHLQPGPVSGLIPFADPEGRWPRVSAIGHKASTLGGNSGSMVIDLDGGRVLGIHFAGAPFVTNWAVPTWELLRDPRVRDLGINFETMTPVAGPDPDVEKAWEALAPKSAQVSVLKAIGEGTSVPQAHLGALVQPSAAVQPTMSAAVPDAGFVVARSDAAWPPAQVAAGTAVLRFDVPIEITVRLGAPQTGARPQASEAAPWPARTERVDVDPDYDSRLGLYRALGVPANSIPGYVPEPGLESAGPQGAPEDLKALDLAGVSAFELLLEEHPEQALHRARKVLDATITENDLRVALRQVRAVLTAPREATRLLEARAALESAAAPLPPDFTFDGMDLAHIPIDPGSTKFETLGDLWGWFIHSGAFALGAPAGDRNKFPFHDDGKHPSRFVYALEEQAGAPLDVALFADFGTGLYHSRYIAKQLAARGFPYAIHLGDVYYAGREEEFVSYFKKELDPLLHKTRLFTMNSNHEMFSKGVPYLNYLAQRRKAAPSLQQQEGSYFCLRGRSAQIIGIDTDYFNEGRHKDPKLQRWLEEQLVFGREHALTNILLSGDQPYEYDKKGLTALLDHDLRGLAVERELVDLWFWGNTHYCALFDRGPGLPFVGSCIGHGGYPYDRLEPNKHAPAPVAFVETTARFPKWTGLRQDRGNNGYCVLKLHPNGDIGLRYVDWMAHDRCLVTLPRAAGGRLGGLQVQPF
jgi:hypothetical protein